MKYLLITICCLTLFFGGIAGVLAATQGGSVDLDANIPDEGGPITIYGCTDPSATNYNSAATVDDGSCQYGPSGCTDPSANNYDASAVTDDGSCTYDVSGCTDPSANNYDPLATINDGSCQYNISGCTDPSAINYNPAAVTDDGSCTYTIVVPVGPGGGDGGGIATTDHPDFRFYVNNNSLQIYPLNGQLTILSGYRLTVSTVKSLLPKPANFVSVILDRNEYFMPLDNAQNIYMTTFDVPDHDGVFNLLLLTRYEDQTISTQHLQLNVVSWGRVHDDWRGEEGVEEAKISLFQNNILIKEILTGSEGFYGLMLPNGGYTAEFSSPRHKTRSLNFDVDNNTINTYVRLYEDLNAIENLASQSQEVLERSADAINQAVLNNPNVEEGNKYVAPTIVAVASINAVVAIPWWNLVYYFQYLFTEPLAWLFRRRKRSWGVIYNSITKKPIDLAVVRLYNNKTKKLLRSKVTDKNGRYNFLIGPGEYYLEVVKPKFIFPSEILRHYDEDRNYVDLYHGQTITFTKDEKGLIAANVPIDQEEAKDISDKQFLRQHFWRRVREYVSIIGPILALISFAISPTLLIGAFAFVHLSLFLLFRRLAVAAKTKSWGMVYDAKTRKPVAKSVARIFSPEHNRMIEAQVTDKYGRYGFLVEDNNYYLTVDKKGYQTYKGKDIDLNNKKSDEVIGYDLPLKKLGDVSGDQEHIPADKIGTKTLSMGKPAEDTHPQSADADSDGGQAEKQEEEKAEPTPKPKEPEPISELETKQESDLPLIEKPKTPPVSDIPSDTLPTTDKIPTSETPADQPIKKEDKFG